ncbi:hypothetical protein V6N13_045210 [Hibiscus sabdariffa]|uniref:RNase H type-1 domain-containing protein n=1 Tax=Hibiscus sabdariffa TaxID=183260 RepID=A0ABR2RKF2_9ROSI
MRLRRNDSTMDGRCSIMWYLLDLQRRNWVVHLNHIPRNLNKLADSLTKLPTSDSLDVIVFDTVLFSISCVAVEVSGEHDDVKKERNKSHKFSDQKTLSLSLVLFQFPGRSKKHSENGLRVPESPTRVDKEALMS